MEYNQLMNLQSPSGYAMPFEADERTGLNIVAGYGEQKDADGKEYYNHGMDFKLQPGTWLKAMATGVVTGISSDFKRGFSLMVNYPNYANGRKSAYDVTYYGISKSLSTFGKNVKAGDNIAVCDDTLHIEVRFNGEEMNPVDFLTMMRDNMLVADQVQAQGTGNNDNIASMDFDVRTPYDNQQGEIHQLMDKFFGSYFGDILRKRYHVSENTEQGLRSSFQEGFSGGLFFEHTPSFLNPFGLGSRASSLIGRIQTILIEDFLNYMALMHHVFLSSMGEDEKKKFLTGH